MNERANKTPNSDFDVTHDQSFTVPRTLANLCSICELGGTKQLMTVPMENSEFSSQSMGNKDSLFPLGQSLSTGT